jgi:hypothetical protein
MWILGDAGGGLQLREIPAIQRYPYFAHKRLALPKEAPHTSVASILHLSLKQLHFCFRALPFSSVALPVKLLRVEVGSFT